MYVHKDLMSVTLSVAALWVLLDIFGSAALQRVR